MLHRNAKPSVRPRGAPLARMGAAVSAALQRFPRRRLLGGYENAKTFAADFGPLERLEPRQLLTAAPVLTLSAVHTATEGSAYTLGLLASGPGAATLDHWTINWGDGGVQTVGPDPGTGLFPASVTHTYADGPKDFRAAATGTNADGTFGARVLDAGSNGVLDNSFGAAGKVAHAANGSAFFAAAVQSDGKVVTAGTSDYYNGGDFLLTRYNADGTLDTTFGTNGNATVDFGGTYDTAYALTIQSDGAIVAAGAAYVPGWGASYSCLAVARFTSAGLIDTTFATGGTYSTASAGSLFESTLRGVAVNYAGTPATNPDYGKIILAGTDGGATGSGTHYKLLLGRLNADGTPDTSFGGVGDNLPGFLDARYSTTYTYDRLNALALQGDGKLVVAGDTNFEPFVARFNADGSPDTSFAAGGWYYGYDANFAGNGTVNALALDAAGNIDTVGTNGGGLYSLFRLTPSGALDTAFGSAGHVYTAPSLYAQGNAIAVQGDGQIVVAGQTFITGMDPSDLLLARYNPDGAPDAGFGTSGSTTTDLGANDVAGGLVVTADGRALLFGRSDASTPQAYAIHAAAAAYELGYADPVHVNNAAPTAAITGLPGGSVPEGTSITLGSTVTDAGAADAAAGFTRAWSVTKNGSPYVTGSGASFTFTADDNGFYVVTLTAADKDGGVSPAVTGTFTATNLAPVAAAAGPTSANEGSAVALTGSAADAAGDLASMVYAWSVTKNGSAYTTGSGASFSFTPNDNGTYVATLTTTDKDGASSSAARQVTVANVAPTLTLPGNVTIPETTAYAAAGSFADPGSGDTWTATVNYGDGTATSALTLNANKTFSLNHAYNDHGVYTVTVVVTDKDGATATGTLVVTDNNAAPNPVVITGASGTLTQGGTYTLGYTAADSAGDTAAGFSASWYVTSPGGGGGTPRTGQTYAWTPTAGGPFTLHVTVTDRDGLSTTVTKDVTVANVAPTLATFTGVASTSTGNAVRNQIVTIRADFTDPGGADDIATYTWNFGDGSALLTVADFNPEHVYAASGNYTASVFATDQSGASSATATKVVHVVNFETQADTTDAAKSTLVVGGTSSADTIAVTAVGTLSVKVSVGGSLLTNPLTSTTTFTPTSRVIVWGGAGDDTVSVAGAVTAGLIEELYGQDGNDSLAAANGNSIVAGGNGNDTVSGGTGRDIIIGGGGIDTLSSSTGDQILISGYTKWDNDPWSLRALLGNWSSTTSDFNTRVAIISDPNGLYGTPVTLKAGVTVFNDNKTNTLTSGAGRDWYFVNANDVLTDFTSGSSGDLKTVLA